MKMVHSGKHVRLCSYPWYLWLLLCGAASCAGPPAGLEPVSFKEFADFVEATGYVTDAERYGWSVVQDDVYSYHVVYGAQWRRPDGVQAVSDPNLPVTQVSHRDALAYCAWSGERLPTYEEYWEMISADRRPVVTENNRPISAVDRVNILGNVWELSATVKGDSVRLAGGSLFCSESTCHGTSKERELWVDRETGNIHIGFAVVPVR